MLSKILKNIICLNQRIQLSGVMPVDGQDVWSCDAHDAVREFFESSMGEAIQVGFSTIYISLFYLLLI